MQRSSKYGIIRMMTKMIRQMITKTKKLYSMIPWTDLLKILPSTVNTDGGAKAKATATEKVATVSVAEVSAKVAKVRTDFAHLDVVSQAAKIGEDEITTARARVRAKVKARKAKALAQKNDKDLSWIFTKVLDLNSSFSLGLLLIILEVQDQALDVINVAAGGTA